MSSAKKLRMKEEYASLLSAFTRKRVVTVLGAFMSKCVVTVTRKLLSIDDVHFHFQVPFSTSSNSSIVTELYLSEYFVEIMIFLRSKCLQNENRTDSPLSRKFYCPPFLR